MGGKGSGKGSGGYRKENPMHNATVDDDFNRRSNAFGLALMKLPDIEDWSDPEALVERFATYLSLCDEHQCLPSVAGLSLSMGISRHNLYDMVQRGYKHKNLTPESRSALRKMYDFLQLKLEANLMEEKGNPVKWIFLGKNYFNFVDQTERVVHTVDDKPVLADPAAVAAKYAAMTGQEPKQLSAIEAEVIDIQPSEPDDSKN